MTDLSALKSANAKRWACANLLRKVDCASVAAHLVGAKGRYLTVQAMGGVPWYIIALIHERECSQDWMASLAQGDRWNETSVHVPAGRGPFRSWEEAAIDALVACPPFAARNKDWSLGGSLTLLERYNGLGYAARGVPSPYLWAGTDQYKSGKYVRDGVYDPNAVDRQLGCAGLLIAMMALNRTIAVDTPAMSSKPIPTGSGIPAIQAKPTRWAEFTALVCSLFKRI
jgi:lysozyme family protein